MVGLTRFLIGLALSCSALNCFGQAGVPFEAEIERFEAADRVNPPQPGGIVFVGSSSIVRWTTLASDFPGYNVINRGFGGSQLSDSVRFATRIVTPYKPKMVVLFAGSNDINDGKSGETVFEDYKKFVTIVHDALPDTKIVYISISPAPSRITKWPEMKKANRLIKDFDRHHKGLIFVDLFDQMLTKTGGPRPELFVQDQLHMSPLGYKIWVTAMKKILPIQDEQALLDKMTGRWTMSGQIRGAQTVQDVDAKWVLNHEYIELHEISRERNSEGKPQYEAIIHISWDPRQRHFACLWLDTSGVTSFAPVGIGHLNSDQNAIVFTFGSATDGLETTFAFDGASRRWSWNIDDRTAGKHSPFARLALIRK